MTLERANLTKYISLPATVTLTPYLHIVCIDLCAISIKKQSHCQMSNISIDVYSEYNNYPQLQNPWKYYKKTIYKYSPHLFMYTFHCLAVDVYSTCWEQMFLYGTWVFWWYFDHFQWNTVWGQIKCCVTQNMGYVKYLEESSVKLYATSMIISWQMCRIGLGYRLK